MMYNKQGLSVIYLFVYSVHQRSSCKVLCLMLCMNWVFVQKDGKWEEERKESKIEKDRDIKREGLRDKVKEIVRD